MNNKQRKIIFRGTICCVSQNYIKKCVSVELYRTKNNGTIYDMLYKKISNDTKEMLMCDIQNKNTNMTDAYIEENDISMLFFPKEPSKRVLKEIVQYDIETIKISKKLLDNYSRIFKYLVDKYIIEYYSV